MWKNECTKFKPNIFNKQKCANCYKIREQHSQEALDVNRATRIVSKCGWLFVAPNWDFSNPVYRTKRWQRRWFVLYDDGELTYSVDDHVETIPQAIINLNTVFEITEADAITGNENSIAIVASDGIHFIKGTCVEESRLWLDILRLFPQAAGQTRQVVGNGGRAKRSATFPGLRSFGNNGAFGSQLNRMAAANSAAAAAAAAASKDEVDGQDPPTPPTTSPPESSPEDSPVLKTKKISLAMIGQDALITPPLTPSSSSSASGATVLPPPPLKKSLSTLSPASILADAPYSSSNNVKNRYERSKSTADFTPVAKKPPAATIDPMASPPVIERNYSAMSIGQRINSSLSNRRAGISSNYSSSSLSSYSSSSSKRTSSCIGLQRAQSSSSLPPSSLMSRRTSSLTVPPPKHIPDDEELLPDPPTESRGAPDGCGLDPASNELLTKKGWLMKQGLTKEWHKYWFVLQDVALLYYRDPKAESKGFLDGIIDLSQVQRIGKQDLPRHFGFYIKTYDGTTTVFSAITDGIRKNWIASLQKAANVSPVPTPVSTTSSKEDHRKFSSSVNEMDVITTTRIVRTSTTTPHQPRVTKVPSLPPPLTLQTSTTTMTFASDVFDSEDSESDDEDDESSSEEEDDCDETQEDNKLVPTTIIAPPTAEPKVDQDPAKTSDGVLVDLLETEVDSLKAKLEMTQNELFSMHHSNKIKSPQSEPPARTQPSKIRMSQANVEPESLQLNKAKSTIAKQNSEITSLKNEISINQLQIQQNLQLLQGEKDANAELMQKVEGLNKNLKSLSEKLRQAEDTNAKEVEKSSKLRHDFEINLGKLETEVDKWKLLHESLYLQYDREQRSWKDKLSRLEKACGDNENSQAEDVRKKNRIISDLSEQLKESDDRIQELSMELDALKDKQATDFAVNNQESISKFVVSMEEKFAASLKTEKEQLEQAFKERLREHEIYEKQQRLVTADVNATASSFGNLTSVRQKEEEEEQERKKSGGSDIEPPVQVDPKKRRVKRPSLVKINSMTDLLSLKVPSVEAIQTMEREDMTEKFLVLLDHFYASVDEIRKLRIKLRESQDNNDALEIDKVRFEESFKRTIVMQEQQEKTMSKRIQDLTNKLLLSEKLVRQLKERKHSKRKDSNLGLSSTSKLETPT